MSRRRRARELRRWERYFRRYPTALWTSPGRERATDRWSAAESYAWRRQRDRDRGFSWSKDQRLVARLMKEAGCPWWGVRTRKASRWRVRWMRGQQRNPRDS